MRKNRHIKRSRFAQNKIAYIVYGNQKEARKLVYDYGYEAPKDIHGLVDTVKLLVKKKGRKVIKDLILIHPDKRAILKLAQPSEDNFCGGCGNHSYLPEDNYCGGCGHVNFTGTTDIGQFLDQLIEMNTTELEKYYQDIFKKANQNPQDSKLADEVQLVWNELRQRMNIAEKEEEKPEENSFCKHIAKSELAIAGVILVTGILIGSAFKSSN